MLPDFLIIGAQKAASTWLAVQLEKHPDVFMCRHEIHFFTNNLKYDKGVPWYERHFADWSGQRRIGEKSPLYLSGPQTPERIREVLGQDVRLIASLRHPVDRAYSAYWHSLKDNRIPPATGFLEAMEALPDLRLNSQYGEQIARYLAVFGKEQLLVQIFEQSSRDRSAALDECLDFLDLDSTGVDAATDNKINVSREIRGFSGPAYRISRRVRRLPWPLSAPLKAGGRLLFKAFPVRRQHEPLSPELRSELMEGFRPDVAKLEDLLGREISDWR